MDYYKKLTIRLFAVGVLAGMSLTMNTVTASELKNHILAVQMENTSLKELFSLIEEEYNYTFLIRDNNIDLNEQVSVNTANRSVEEILAEALKKQQATFEVNGNRIVVYKAKSEAQPIQAQRSQQIIKVTGTIIDDVTREPIIGANIVVKGTNTGTSSDIDGNFTLDAPAGATLVISYIGYVNTEVTTTGTKMTIRIREDTKALEEVIVVGYSTQKKESLTGALQTLNNDKLTNITTPNVENMLSGKAPGVYVAPGGGRPGDRGNVVIRGRTSINGNTDPLWVIDGVIVGNRSDDSLNPADIETMTILKDAASTAIYGSQGANGVIVITTKRAKGEKVTLNASAKLGINNLSNGKMKVMNGDELYTYFKSFSNQEMISFPRWNDDLRNSNYDWWDIATQTGWVQDYNLSLSGGTDKMKSFLSLGLYDEEGAVRGYQYTRYNLRFKTEYKLFDWLTIKPSVSGSKEDIDNKQYQVSAMYSYLPWDSPYLEDGSPTPHRSQTWVNSNTTNYLYDLQWNWSDEFRYSLMGNFDFDIRLTKWLTFSSVNNYTWNDSQRKEYVDPRSNSGSGVNGRLVERDEKVERRYTNQLLRFNHSFGKHAINGLAAYEFSDYKYKWFSATGTGFVPGREVLSVSAIPEQVRGTTTESAIQSYLFNGNYAYDNKYLAQVSFRRDGASNFGDNAKYGNFYSVSGGWNINKENFLSHITWINILKIRASYGTTGTRPNELYPQYDLYQLSESYNKYDGIPGALIYKIGNKDLTWEKTKSLGIGLDFNAFDRLRVTLDYYNKNTADVLFNVPVSALTGVTNIWQNVGEINNYGFEVTLGGDIIRTKDWFFGMDFNLGLNRNEVKKLYGGADEIINNNISGTAGSAGTILKPGYSSDTWYLREWAGVNPENGSPQWYKTDDSGNRVLTGLYAEADEVMCGRYSPDFFGGFSLNANWRKIDFSAVFGYSVGGTIYSYSRQEYDSDGAYTDRNQMKLMKDWSRWAAPGDIATHPIAAYNNPSNSNKVSSRYLEDGDYLKLRSLTIGYNFKLPQWHISNLRLYFAGENLFTITGYSGVDPEIPVRSDTRAVIGVGRTDYPVTRKFMFGLNITL